ncbi:hypothetical protein HG530_011574 [Fusarium avenaceum]|nr:hypothetical protein HG530_011574 [Fusarium avenaceum]
MKLHVFIYCLSTGALAGPCKPQRPVSSLQQNSQHSLTISIPHVSTATGTPSDHAGGHYPTWKDSDGHSSLGQSNVDTSTFGESQSLDTVSGTSTQTSSGHSTIGESPQHTHSFSEISAPVFPSFDTSKSSASVLSTALSDFPEDGVDKPSGSRTSEDLSEITSLASEGGQIEGSHPATATPTITRVPSPSRSDEPTLVDTQANKSNGQEPSVSGSSDTAEPPVITATPKSESSIASFVSDPMTGSDTLSSELAPSISFDTSATLEPGLSPSLPTSGPFSPAVTSGLDFTSPSESSAPSATLSPITSDASVTSDLTLPPDPSTTSGPTPSSILSEPSGLSITLMPGTSVSFTTSRIPELSEPRPSFSSALEQTESSVPSATPEPSDSTPSAPSVTSTSEPSPTSEPVEVSDINSSFSRRPTSSLNLEPAGPSVPSDHSAQNPSPTATVTNQPVDSTCISDRPEWTQNTWITTTSKGASEATVVPVIVGEDCDDIIFGLPPIAGVVFKRPGRPGISFPCIPSLDPRCAAPPVVHQGGSSDDGEGEGDDDSESLTESYTSAVSTTSTTSAESCPTGGSCACTLPPVDPDVVDEEESDLWASDTKGLLRRGNPKPKDMLGLGPNGKGLCPIKGKLKFPGYPKGRSLLTRDMKGKLSAKENEISRWYVYENECRNSYKQVDASTYSNMFEKLEGDNSASTDHVYEKSFLKDFFAVILSQEVPSVKESPDIDREQITCDDLNYYVWDEVNNINRLQAAFDTYPSDKKWLEDLVGMQQALNGGPKGGIVTTFGGNSVKTLTDNKMRDPNYSTWGAVEDSLNIYLFPFIEKIYVGIQLFNDPVLVAAMLRQNKRVYSAFLDLDHTISCYEGMGKWSFAERFKSYMESRFTGQEDYSINRWAIYAKDNITPIIQGYLDNLPAYDDDETQADEQRRMVALWTQRFQKAMSAAYTVEFSWDWTVGETGIAPRAGGICRRPTASLTTLSTSVISRTSSQSAATTTGLEPCLTDADNIQDWAEDGGESLEKEERGCGAIAKWDWKEGHTPSVVFTLPFFMKAGCVERAIISAGGPELQCDGHSPWDELSLMAAKNANTPEQSTWKRPSFPERFKEVNRQAEGKYPHPSKGEHPQYIPMSWSSSAPTM